MRYRAWLACAVTALVPLAQAAQRTELVAVGAAPSTAYADSLTGKVFVMNAAPAGGTGSIAVRERNGRVATVTLDPAPVHFAASGVLRRVVVAQAGQQATVIDMDSLRATVLPVGPNPQRVVMAESTGMAYVIGRNANAADGTITAIDLRYNAARTVTFAGFVPTVGAFDADSGKLYLAGTRAERDSEWPAAYVQAFHPALMQPFAEPIRIGRAVRELQVSPSGEEVYVLGHVDVSRPEAPEAARNGLRPALFVLEPDLTTRRVIELPESRNLTQPLLQGEMQVDARRGTVYVTDRQNARLDVVNAMNGTVGVTDLESAPSGLALNPVAGTVVVALPLAGQAAVLAPSGQRLDTVPIAKPPMDRKLVGQYAVAVDGTSGDAYVANGHDGTLSMLPREPGAAGLVNLTDLWVSPAEPGWGLFIDQQGTTAFAALFLYGNGGEASWVVMSNGTRQADGSFSGLLYRTRGPSHLAASQVAPVGLLRFRPAADGSASVTYVVDGVSQTKSLERFGLERAPAACRWGLASALPRAAVAKSNFTGLWANPADPGWGIALSQRGASAFGVLFTYDDQNRPSWMVMSNGQAQGPGQFAGELYRVSRAKVESVGAMTLRFGAADEGAVTYRMDGTEFRAPLLRQVFAPLLSRCG